VATKELGHVTVQTTRTQKKGVGVYGYTRFGAWLDDELGNENLEDTHEGRARAAQLLIGIEKSAVTGECCSIFHCGF